jgi:hypothetical protein
MAAPLGIANPKRRRLLAFGDALEKQFPQNG